MYFAVVKSIAKLKTMNSAWNTPACLGICNFHVLLSLFDGESQAEC